MKKIFILSLAIMGFSLNAQINSSSAINNSTAGENPFLDASSYSPVNGWTNSESKGLAFPETDLTQFRFKTDFLANFPTAFNGMVVYNTAESGATADPALTTQTTGLTVGLYYFYNPTGSTSGSVTAGRWLPVGANTKTNITTTEIATNTLVNNNQVYAKKGRFVASGTSTAPTSYPDGAITVPASGTAGIYRVTVFKAGTGSVFANGVYSYDIATGNLITGSPSMSVVYPAGTYDYVVEYTK